MKPTPRLAFLVLTALLFAPVRSAEAQTAAAQTTTAEKDSTGGEEFSRVSGLFDVDLPKTQPRNRVRVIVHPHFGDLLHRDYLRVPVGFRYGLNDLTELNAEIDSYLTHGLRKRSAGYGVSELRLGAKYEWNQWLKPTLDTSTGINFRVPLGRPPLELTDGYNHAAPYVVFSRRLSEWPGFTPFVTLSTDVMWKSSVPGSFQRNQPHRDSLSVAPGFLWERGAFKYTLVCTYTTTALISRGSTNILSINPSVLWQLPPALVFHTTGRWIVGAGVRVTTGPDGTEVSTGAKLRGEFSLSRLFGKSPASAGAPAKP